MATATELLRQGKKREIWEKYCGFLDLNIGQYMAIQRKLLEEQLPRLAGCELGARIMRGARPKTMEDFRATVPFTTYKDYEPFLLSRNEDVLPEKPFVWAHTSGNSGEYALKWIPYTRRMYDILGEVSLSAFIIAMAKKRGDVKLHAGMKIPYLVAPPPYASGLLFQSLMEQFDFVAFPPIEKAVTMEFQERIREAFRRALSEGLDFFFGVTSILLKISESLGRIGQRGSAAKIPMDPRALFRISKALLKRALTGKPIQLKDMWKVSGVLCGGTDTSIFKNTVAQSWGVEPLEAYVATEYLGMGPQSWTRGGFVFHPEFDFWEFLPEKDYRAVVQDSSLIPRSFLMDEVQPGSEYVLVGTNFYGGAMIRYIVGDLVKVTALEDPAAGILLPQITYVSRIDGLIDIGNFTRLTEKIIWLAIEDSGVPYEEWTVRKESRGGQPILHLYLELREGTATAAAVAEKIHEELKKIDRPYHDLEEMIGMKPLTVSILSKGTFHRYYEERQAAGADLGHLKPPHVNASDKVIENLLRMSSWKI